MDIPMVQMMLVRRNSRGGLYSVFKLESHSARVWPKAWWSRELAIVYTVVAEVSWRCPSSAGGRWILTGAGGVLGAADELVL